MMTAEAAKPSRKTGALVEHIVHASCVDVDGQGVLLLGKSGSGKSDLALRLIDEGAQLVADDQVHLVAKNEELYASAPGRLTGLLEVRGVGILRLPYRREVRLRLAVRNVFETEVERYPHAQYYDCEGVRIPLCSLCAFDHSTPAKIRAVLRAWGDEARMRRSMTAGEC